MQWTLAISLIAPPPPVPHTHTLPPLTTSDLKNPLCWQISKPGHHRGVAGRGQPNAMAGAPSGGDCWKCSPCSSLSSPKLWRVHQRPQTGLRMSAHTSTAVWITMVKNVLKMLPTFKNLDVLHKNLGLRLLLKPDLLMMGWGGSGFHCGHFGLCTVCPTQDRRSVLSGVSQIPRSSLKLRRCPYLETGSWWM